jgi:hypothetical protein
MIVAAWGANTRRGKVTLDRGKARFSFPTSSGDLYYYEEVQGRVITLRPDFGGWDAQVQAAQVVARLAARQAATLASIWRAWISRCSA